MEKKEFKYNGETVGFEVEDKNVMVNATQMAKIFGKSINGFMENESTIRTPTAPDAPSPARLLRTLQKE